MESSVISPFATFMRELRAKRSYLMGDQAEALQCSVAFVSAVETGTKAIPDKYLEKIISWLELSDAEAKELRTAADASSKLVRLYPKSHEQALLAVGLSKKLSQLGIDEIRKLRVLVEGTQSDNE